MDIPVLDQDEQEANNPDASHKPGEAQGRTTSEIEAAEQPTDTAERTNPVAEATGKESKDPYAEGKHIANPEPNNGAGVKPEDLDPTEKPGDDEDDMSAKEVTADDTPTSDDPESDAGKVYDPSSQPAADAR